MCKWYVKLFVGYLSYILLEGINVLMYIYNNLKLDFIYNDFIY